MASNFYVMKYNIKRALAEPIDSETPTLSKQDRQALNRAVQESNYLNYFPYFYLLIDSLYAGYGLRK